MAFGEILLAGYSGQSRAGKMAPSCPLGQPNTARDLVHLARSRSQPYNKLVYTKRVDRRALVAQFNILCYLPPRNLGKRWRPSILSHCFSIYTKTTIHLTVRCQRCIVVNFIESSAIAIYSISTWVHTLEYIIGKNFYSVSLVLRTTLRQDLHKLCI